MGIEACLKWVSLFLGLLTVLRIVTLPQRLLSCDLRISWVWSIQVSMVNVERGLGRRGEEAVRVLWAGKNTPNWRHFFIISWGFDGRRILKRTIATEVWRALPGRMIPKLLQCKAGFEWIYGKWEFNVCSALGWYLVTWGTLLQSSLDILGPWFYELLASFYKVLVSFYKIPLRQEGKWDKLWNNSLISHSKPHEIHYGDSKSPCGVCKLNPHFRAAMAKLKSITPSQPLWALAHFGATWGMWNNVLSLLLECGEASKSGEKCEGSHPDVAATMRRQSLLSLLSLKLQHNLSDLCVEQHCVSFHCVQTFLLLKMLQFMEQLVLKATTFCISSV